MAYRMLSTKIDSGNYAADLLLNYSTVVMLAVGHTVVVVAVVVVVETTLRRDM